MRNKRGGQRESALCRKNKQIIFNVSLFFNNIYREVGVNE